MHTTFIRRGFLPAFVPEGAFLFLGTVRNQLDITLGHANDSGPNDWSEGRFSLEHQCAGMGMAQAVLDGAFFPLRIDDASPLNIGLRALTGPYEQWELEGPNVDDVAAKAARLLNATPLPSNFERPCGEALHLFRLDDSVVKLVTGSFQMATALSNDGGVAVEELGAAPFSTLAELSRWCDAATDHLVAALVYENCD